MIRVLWKRINPWMITNIPIPTSNKKVYKMERNFENFITNVFGGTWASSYSIDGSPGFPKHRGHFCSKSCRPKIEENKQLILIQEMLQNQRQSSAPFVKPLIPSLNEFNTWETTIPCSLTQSSRKIAVPRTFAKST